MMAMLCSAKESGFLRTRNMNTATLNKFHISCLVMIISLFFVLRMSQAIDTLSAAEVLRDGETMISSGGNFELGFFRPGNSKNRYVGIWYKKTTAKTVVWVANRGIPLTNTSGMLRVVEPGVVVILDESNKAIWSTNSSKNVRNPIAQLLDTGNFVVKDASDGNPENFLWQSFSYPTDTLLPGMKLGWDFRTGHEVYLSSWKSDDDPQVGDYTYNCDPTGYPRLVIMKGGATVCSTGPWNGLGFSGVPNIKENTFFRYEFVMNKNEVYYHYEIINSAVISRLAINMSGHVQRWNWADQAIGWVLFHSGPTDDCAVFKFCGAYGNCNIANAPRCGCLDKFVPKDPDGWNRTDWTNGCVRRTSLNCQKGDGFLKYSGIKLPDTESSRFNESLSLDECKALCLKNCTCTAYTSLDISRRGNGCLLWFDELVDIRVLPASGQDIYIRIASSELDSDGWKHMLKVILPVGIFLLALSVILYFWRRRTTTTNDFPSRRQRLDLSTTQHDGSHKKDLELPLFDLCTITKATDDFSMSNKIGEGGFGPVFKGRLEDGKEIAVKRLSRTSHQGVDEFKNEVMCIAELQHRNLVKLLDPEKSGKLDWPKHFNIINGIARGLMYLHQDSRLRIIHRDLKASNVLLDSDMNPKISDFGMARMFGGNETSANTSRVVGTYGYMAPEYAIDGLFSVKSDVYSFGVLVLEIVSGKRNRRFHHRDHQFNLLGHAWVLYKEEKTFALIDSYPHNSSHISGILRSIQIGLLCVQQYPEDRPSMSSVVLMLGNEGPLPEAKQPGFFTGRDVLKPETSFSSNTASSANAISITLLEAR